MAPLLSSCNGWYAYCGVTAPSLSVPAYTGDGCDSSGDCENLMTVGPGCYKDDVMLDTLLRSHILEKLVDNKLLELELKYGPQNLDCGGCKAGDIPETMQFQNFNPTLKFK